MLLHGAANDCREWSLTLEALSQHYRVYAPDLVGYGHSDKPKTEYSLGYFVRFLSDFIAALKLNRGKLVGHSLGGAVGIGFASDFPDVVNKLVLVDSHVFMARNSLVTKLLTPIYMLDSVLRLGWASGFEVRRRIRGQEWGTVSDRLHRVKAPTLIIWEDQDRYLPVDHAYAIQRLIDNSQLHVFRECGHAPQKERPREFDRVVLEFLSQG